MKPPINQVTSKPVAVDPGDFEEIPGRIIPRLTICSHAKSKAGKTWLALKAPGDIGVIGMDINCEEICNKYKIMYPEKKIYYKNFSRSPLSQISDTNELKKHWGYVRDAHFRLLSKPNIRTVIWDTGSQMWEDCSLAWLGRPMDDKSAELDAAGKPTGKLISTAKTNPRNYGDPQKDFREMVNAIGDKNLIITHWADDEWIDNPTNPGGIGLKTGNIKRKGGMKGIEYLAQVEIYQFRCEVTGSFVIRMMSSTANSDIRGRKGKVEFVRSQAEYVCGEDELKDGDANFAMIALSVFPSTKLDEWGVAEWDMS